MTVVMDMSPPTTQDAPGTARAKDYAIRELDLATEQPTAIMLWRTHMRLPPEAKLDWFYLQHPCGTPKLLLLTHGAQATPVGIGSLGQRRVSIQGQPASAGILADMVVLPEHRTLFPALLLQKQMLHAAVAAYSVVYGIPNKHSTPIVRRLGYTRVGELIRYARVLRLSDYIERRLPRFLSRPIGALVDRLMPLYYRPYELLMKEWRSGWTEDIDERFDRLWSRARAFDGIIGERGAAFIRWRFLSQPEHRHRVFTLAPKAAQGGEEEITAYAVCEAVGRTLHLRDILVDPAHEDHVRLLLHLLAVEARLNGFSNLSLEFMGPRRMHDLLSAAGLLERDTRALYAHFGSSNEATLRKLDWYVTSADEDQ